TASLSVPTSAPPQAAASPTSTATSSPAGTATTTSCPCSARPASCRRPWNKPGNASPPASPISSRVPEPAPAGPRDAPSRPPPAILNMASKKLHFPSPRHLHQLYAGREANLALAERLLGVRLVSRDDWLAIDGSDAAIARTEVLLGFLQEARAQGVAIRTPDFERFADLVARGEDTQLRALFDQPLI